ncbi:MAG: hypothetical protein LBI68_06860 [Azoarcus sp.]|nr:hypothetical protein [Azoarcus sp.]
MQLDLFAHSRPVMLRNDLILALRERQSAASREAHARLAGEYPEDGLLIPAQRLLDQLEAPRPAPFSSHKDAQCAIEQAESALADSASTVFGAVMASDWMTPVWQILADACEKLPYQRNIPSANPACMLMRSRCWDAAEAAIARIPNWRRMPEPLAWMAEARFKLRGLGSVWPLLAELAWRAPARFAALARRLDATALARLLRGFESEFATGDDADFAWFPAWALSTEAKLVDGLLEEHTPEYSPPEQAAWTIRQLLILERQGRHHEIVKNRETLRDLHPELFAYYMRSR